MVIKVLVCHDPMKCLTFLTFEETLLAMIKNKNGTGIKLKLDNLRAFFFICEGKFQLPRNPRAILQTQGLDEF